MFNKFLKVIIFLLPLWFAIFIGFPSSKNYYVSPVKGNNNHTLSKRCFGVGDIGEFMGCWNRSHQLKGADLAQEVLNKTSAQSPVVTLILSSSFTIFIIVSILIL